MLQTIAVIAVDILLFKRKAFELGERGNAQHWPFHLVCMSNPRLYVQPLNSSDFPAREKPKQ